jgi:hypothetical protein
MEKAPIKKFAVEARKKLKADVTFQLERYGITENGIVEPQTSTDKELVFDLGNGNTQTIKGERYVNQYRNLAAHVRGFYTTDEPKKELEQFIEEIAYTWFNRLIAIRFMEVNRYLPVRVLSSEITGQKLPDLVKAPFSGDLEFTEDEKKRIFELQDANKEDDLFRFLFFKQCNDLSCILPRLFENLEGHNSFSELLITLSFNDPNGVVYRLVNEVDERWFDIHTVDEDGKPIGQVQIIGWMYQYYNTEPKDKVFADLKKNIKISKQNIPAATQLFTPDWIVRYMVENSLGRLWYEGHPDFDKSDWKYYLDEAPQEPQVEQQLKDIRAQYAKMEPEQLKVIDPCMGSGHILCYLFDVLMQIYLDNGYSKREAVRSILENNLFGLDIDKRAAQFAYFSVMMKAREYDSNFFSRSNIPQPRVYDIQESNWLGGAYKHEMGNFLNSQQHRDTLNYLLDAFVDAKEYGSILQIKPLDYEGLKEAWETSAAATAHDVNMAMWYDAAKDAVAQLIEQAILLSQKYDAVVTNPPYMGASGMGAKLAEFVKEKYPDTKSDMSTVCMERTLKMCNSTGYMAMINIPVWMFISSYEKLRNNILSENTFVNMIHPGRGIFGSDFGTTTFVIQKHRIPNYVGHYRRLFEKQGEVESIATREQRFFEKKGMYYSRQDDFSIIPGSPIAYWVCAQIFRAFENGRSLNSIAPTRKGMFTGNNDMWLKLWYEINKTDFCATFKPYNKGGEYRKWFGNNEYVINWGEDGESVKSYKGSGNITDKLFFHPCLTWSLVTSYKPSFRAIIDYDHVMGDAGPIVVASKDDFYYLLALLNSKFTDEIASLIAPTINFSNGAAGTIPVILPQASTRSIIEKMSIENVNSSKKDWDAFETSWDFKKHPLV